MRVNACKIISMKDGKILGMVLGMEGKENTMSETKTVEERSLELWELDRQQKEEDRGGDYVEPKRPTKKTEPEFLHVVIKGHVVTSLDACIFGAGFVFAFLLMIIF